ncbi:hypothetical protein SteCoe_18226 [Stentor coeruleus]|uniref:RING-type domain-containing protein n=1 Tax=Stentor coeruleus TaxID=5963 RepID=A0A1R2BX10_9CILI|nr:hypothetical protein SteCoe_18226 [Stentor coeruleus]
MFLKAFLSLVLPCILAKLTILTPDSISNLNPIYALTAYSNPNLLPIYGRFILIDIDSNCIVTKTVDLGPETIAVLYNTEKYECDFSVLSQIIEKSGSSALLISVNKQTILKSFNNLYTSQFLYKTHQNYKINIPSLLIDENFGQILKNNSNYQIWGTYVYDDIKRTNYPVIKYFMSSDFNIDRVFIEKLFYINNFIADIRIQELSFFFLTRFDINTQDNCYKASDGSLYCVEETGHITGNIKILNTILILNVLNSHSYYDTDAFLMYLLDLYAKCSTDYSLFCHQEVLNTYGLQANYTDNVLKNSYSNIEIINSISVNEVFIYSPDKLIELYIISSNLASLNNNCSSSCTYYNITDDKCQIGCNISQCGYDNLVCLVNEKCYSFMVGDENCGNGFVDDKDFHEKEEKVIDKVFVMVLILVLSFVIIILSICLIVLLCKRKRAYALPQAPDVSSLEINEKPELPKFQANFEYEKVDIEINSIELPKFQVNFEYEKVDIEINSIKKNTKKYTPVDSEPKQIIESVTFSDALAFTGEPICRLDNKYFSEGEAVIVMQDGCKHIFHIKCYNKWVIENKGLRKCPNCSD